MNKAGSLDESTIQKQRIRVSLCFTPYVSKCTRWMICIYLHKLSSSRCVFCYSVQSQPLILMVAKENVLNALNMGWIHSLHSLKPLILLVPFTKRSTNYPPNIFLWSKTKRVNEAETFSLERLWAFRWLHPRGQTHLWSANWPAANLFLISDSR